MSSVQIPHHAIQNVSFNWDDHDKFLPGKPGFPALMLCRRHLTPTLSTLP